MNHNGNGRPHDDLPPTNPEAERGLLRSIFALPSTLDLPEVVAVQPGDFFDLGFRVIHRHVVGAWLEGQSPEVLCSRIAAAGELSDDIKAAVMELASAGVSGNDVKYFAGEVRETSERRKLWQVVREVWQQNADNIPAADIRGFLESALDAMGRTTGRERRFQKLSAADLDAISDDVPYIVPNVLADAQPALCCGGSKSLKTSVLCDLVLSSCWGGHFLGFFPVAKSVRAWFISGESGDRTIRETNRRIAAAAGKEFRTTADYFYSATLPQLSDAADVAELGREIKADGITLLVLDPMYLAMQMDGREGSVFAVGPMLRRVTEVCAKHSCTLIIVHHAKQSKAKDFNPPTINDASWAGFEQFARQWILLGRREAYRDGSGQHRLWLSTGGSAGHGGLYHLDIDEGTRATPGGRFWDARVTAAGEAKAITLEHMAAAAAERDERRLQEHKQKILDALRTFPKGETRKGLRTATRLHDAPFTEAIQELIREGNVQLCEVKKHTALHDGYRLTDPQKELCRDMVGHAG